ncbi:hypothetical protein OI71_19905 [Aeromonas hydrophila]|nr:hypothetical protein OI71_19905 [Aeromonas hydrophila]
MLFIKGTKIDKLLLDGVFYILLHGFNQRINNILKTLISWITKPNLLAILVNFNLCFLCSPLA